MAVEDKLVTVAEAKVINDRVKPITEGGTNATTASDARNNLDVYSKSEVNAFSCLVVTATIDSLPKDISNANITADMVVLNSTLGTPSAQTSDWTVTTSAGKATVSGSISGSTTLTLYLGKSR